MTRFSIAAIAFGAAVLSSFAAPPAAPPAQAAVTCFKSGEQTSGMNRICYYNCLGSQAAITISISEMCPLSIRR